MRKHPKITFNDIYVLRACAAKGDNYFSHPALLPGFGGWDGAINNLLKAEGVIREDGTPTSLAHGTMLKSRGTFYDALQKWRLLGFIEAGSRNHTVTPKGHDFIKSLPKDWHDYPISIPIIDHQLDWSAAKYAE